MPSKKRLLVIYENRNMASDAKSVWNWEKYHREHVSWSMVRLDPGTASMLNNSTLTIRDKPHFKRKRRRFIKLVQAAIAAKAFYRNGRQVNIPDASLR